MSQRKSMSRKSMSRKSMSRKSMSRKSMSRKSLGGKRKSRAGGGTGKGGGGGKTSEGEKARMRHPMYHIKEVLNNPENIETLCKFYKELMEKKEDLVKDCRYGRKRFVDWLATFLKGEGMVTEVRPMPAYDLQIYGPEGPPCAILGYPLNPDPARWTMCIFGRYEQVEERVKDPALLFNGKLCYRRRPPEAWGVLACWLATLKALSMARDPPPVNIKVCFTALQTDDAPAMIRFINSIKPEFLRAVDFFVYATTLSVTTLPGGIAYSGRGVCHFVMDISDENPAQEICSSLTGPLRQTAHDMVKLIDSLEKDCVYTYLNMFEDFILPHRFLKLVRRVYVKDLNPIKGIFQRKRVLAAKEKRAVEMWKPVVALQDMQAFSQHPLKIPTKLVIRFSVKYMTEASPAQVEEMVNRMLCKKWLAMESDLSCRLSMEYWARPWYAVNKNRLYKPIKKAAVRAFHQCPTEALDFAPNSLPAILQRLIPEDFCMIILASMPDMNHHRFRKNLKRNMKMLCSFFFEVAKVKTEKTFSWNWNKCRKRTRHYRIRHRKMDKRWRPPVDPDHPEEEPSPVLPPEDYNEESPLKGSYKGSVKGSKDAAKSSKRASQAGKRASQAGKRASQAGKRASQAGKRASQAGKRASQADKPAPPPKPKRQSMKRKSMK